MTLPYDMLPKVLGVIHLVSAGRSKTSACDEAEVSYAAFKKYVDASPELTQALEEAEQRGYDTLADILLEIDRDPHYGQSDPKMAKVISDNIKWLLARRRPKDYGDKVQVDVNITADRAITDALNRARNRQQQIEHTAQPVIDAEYVEVLDANDSAILAEILA